MDTHSKALPAHERLQPYAIGTEPRSVLERELEWQINEPQLIPAVIGGREVTRSSHHSVHCPHDHQRKLCTLSLVDESDVHLAASAASAAAQGWSRTSLSERAAVFLRAAELLTGPWRQELVAATMLGQGKTVLQADGDSGCQLADFIRFGVHFAHQIEADQPTSPEGAINRLEYRPLEGFVYAVTPFNFTSTAANLAIVPALMGNTVLWKPALTAAASNYVVMKALMHAGLPPGVINFLPGEPNAVTKAVLGRPDFAGLSFTGSTAVFSMLWRQIGERVSTYRAFPRLIGETGGKGFVLAHQSADVDDVCNALVRGAFEYQGQKCSAASRAYISKSLWRTLKPRLLEEVESISIGAVTDLSNFMSAVIDRNAFERITQVLEEARKDVDVRFLSGGQSDAQVGYFIRPTVVEVTEPTHRLLQEELFGPLLPVYVYDDDRWCETLKLIDSTSPYGLTGAVFARDRSSIKEALLTLNHAAGNLYINDKPTGSVVNEQPYGGGRKSGTNDKAGSALNLLRWTSPRAIKESLRPVAGWRANVCESR